jgi:3'-phosphoadenosine 5'-phosphosulfate (PAPS) 3'-phosphatase
MLQERAVAHTAIERCIEHISANRKNLSVHSKVDANGNLETVTNLDVTLNQLIIDCIRSVFPNDPIVGEELNSVTNLSYNRYWLVDPIDGTRSFVEGRHGAAVAIALVVGGQPALSVVYDIFGGVVFSCLPDSDPAEGDKAIAAPPAQKVALWNPYQTSELRDRIVNACSLVGFEEIESTSLRAIAIAKGVGCLFLSLPGSSKIWDSGPAAPFLRWSGAPYTDLDGNELKFSPSSLVNKRGALATRGLDHHLALKGIGTAVELT